MKKENLEHFCALVKKESGIVLTAEKGYLLESRLVPVARKWKLADLDALAEQSQRLGTTEMVREIVDAMTTNESFFFRDVKPFDQFRDFVLPKLLEARADKKHIRIWSAACSNGQEPYSLAILLKEAAVKLSGWRVEIIATDISREVLAKAKAGVYSQFEVQRGLPITLLVKYFKQDGDKWRIDPALRAMITFREFNLLEDTRSLGRFDVVFCRNVLIYFDQSTKTMVLDRIANILETDGFLCLGGAETVLGMSDRFVSITGQRGLYEQGIGTPIMRAAS